MQIFRNPPTPTIAAKGLALSIALACSSAHGVGLNAPVGGTFTINLDRTALAPYGQGAYYLSAYWTGAASDYANPVNSGPSLVSQVGPIEIPATNQVFDLTPIGPDPTGQAVQRFVKGTSSNFALDSDTLVGVPGARIGMAGVQGFYAPLWPPSGSGLLNGDFSLEYSTPASRATAWAGYGVSGMPTGWRLDNNIYFPMAVYDLGNLSVTFTDADNWRLSGDLLMSPENGWMLKGPALTDVGDFCVGTGSYAGCGQVTAVPLPAAAWLFGSAGLGLAGLVRRRC